MNSDLKNNNLFLSIATNHISYFDGIPIDGQIKFFASVTSPQYGYK